jgi:hypothetical protein
MWKSPLQQYSKISEQESPLSTSSAKEHEEPNHHFYQPSYRKGFFLLLSLLAIILGGGLINSVLKLQRTATNRTITPQSCGNSTTEAKALGCEFDLLSSIWLPPACLDHETNAEYREWLSDSERERGAFPFFTDQNLTKRITNEDELSERAFVRTYGTWEQHLGHCVFLQRRLYRSMTGVFRMEEHFRNLGHMLHCTNENLKGIKEVKDGNPKWSYFEVWFGTC